MVKRFHDLVVSDMSGRLAPDRLVLFMTSADINIRQGIRASQVSIQILVFGRYAPGRLELVASYTFMKAAAVSAKASTIAAFVKSAKTSTVVWTSSRVNGVNKWRSPKRRCHRLLVLEFG